MRKNPLNHTGIGNYPQKGVIMKKALRLAEVKALFDSELLPGEAVRQVPAELSLCPIQGVFLG